MSGKRPPSLSDSNIYIGNYRFNSINDFHSRQKPLLEDVEIVKIPEIETIITNKTETWFEFCVDYSLRFVGHVFLISIFEALFFFAFVAKDEDKGILATTNFYTKSIINSCSTLTKNESIFLNLILGKIFNSSQILSSGADSAVHRQNNNMALFNLAWSYVGIFGGIECFLLLISYANNFKIKWGHIIFENLALVCFLGVYEFMFFETVIKKYSTESPQEISAQFISGLQQQCGLLT